MFAMQAVIVPIEAFHWDRTTYPARIWEKPRGSICASASDDSPGKGEDDLVITPGGPRPRRQVHQVRPGETVRHNEDGTFTIVPSDVPASPEPGSKKPDEK
jgi:hypothetical protein